MQDMATRMADTLSDGERQKVMIAKALAQQTPVIFLDEPTAFLDYPSKVETMLLLRRLARETGKIIFLSTHDVELALQTSDTLWLMKRDKQYGHERVKEKRKGEAEIHKSLIIGSPQELAANGELGAFFTGKDFTFDKEEMRFCVKEM